MIEEKVEGPEDKYLSLEDLTKKELMEILVKDFSVEESKIKRLNKDDLILMVEEKKGE